SAIPHAFVMASTHAGAPEHVLVLVPGADPVQQLVHMLVVDTVADAAAIALEMTVPLASIARNAAEAVGMRTPVASASSLTVYTKRPAKWIALSNFSRVGSPKVLKVPAHSSARSRLRCNSPCSDMAASFLLLVEEINAVKSGCSQLSVCAPNCAHHQLIHSDSSECRGGVKTVSPT